MPSLVYFIRPVGLCGPTKIGVSSHIASRFRLICVNSPVPLEIVAVIPGDARLESRFHRAFKHLHSHGEWFIYSKDIDEVVEKITSGVFDVSILPAKGLGIAYVKGSCDRHANKERHN